MRRRLALAATLLTLALAPAAASAPAAVSFAGTASGDTAALDVAQLTRDSPTNVPEDYARSEITTTPAHAHAVAGPVDFGLLETFGSVKSPARAEADAQAGNIPPDDHTSVVTPLDLFGGATRVATGEFTVATDQTPAARADGRVHGLRVGHPQAPQVALGVETAAAHSDSGVASDGRLTGESSLSLGGVDVAGVLHIDALRQRAVVRASPTAATPDATTVITGATVGGVAVTVDEHGVHADRTDVPLAVYDDVDRAVLSQLRAHGLDVRVGVPKVVRDGRGAASVEAAPLFVRYSDGDQGFYLLVGITRAMANARTAEAVPFASDLPAATPGATTLGAATLGALSGAGGTDHPVVEPLGAGTGGAGGAGVTRTIVRAPLLVETITTTKRRPVALVRALVAVCVGWALTLALVVGALARRRVPALDVAYAAAARAYDHFARSYLRW